ncbi:Fc.00g008570.m01.CDS01 [Cosmosporella sp. VM-42]
MSNTTLTAMDTSATAPTLVDLWSKFVNQIEPQLPSNAASRLLKLPSEVIMIIIEQGDLDQDTLKALAFTSSRLFLLARKYFYRAEDCKAFAQAAYYGDLDTFERCVTYKASRPNKILSVFGDKTMKVHGDWPTDMEHEYTMMGMAIKGFEDNKMTFQQCARTLEWLLDAGADLNEEYGFVIDDNALPSYDINTQYSIVLGDNVTPRQPRSERMTVVQQLFLLLLKRYTAQDLEAIMRIIRLFLSSGAALPDYEFSLLDQSPAMYPITRFRPYGNDDVGLLLNEYDVNPISVAMMLHIPPKLLVMVLRTHRHYGFETVVAGNPPFQAATLQTPESDLGWECKEEVGPFAMSIHLDRLVRNIHSHLFHPNGAYIEDFYGQVPDVLLMKVQMLVEHGAVLDCDRKVLEGLVAAVKRVYFFGVNSTFDMETNGKICWDMLVQPLKAFKTREYHQAIIDANNNGSYRQYRFTISKPGWAIELPCSKHYACDGVSPWNPDVEWKLSSSWYKHWQALNDQDWERAMSDFVFSGKHVIDHEAVAGPHCCYCRRLDDFDKRRQRIKKALAWMHQ